MPIHHRSSENPPDWVGLILASQRGRRSRSALKHRRTSIRVDGTTAHHPHTAKRCRCSIGQNVPMLISTGNNAVKFRRSKQQGICRIHQLMREWHVREFFLPDLRDNLPPEVVLKNTIRSGFNCSFTT